MTIFLDPRKQTGGEAAGGPHTQSYSSPASVLLESNFHASSDLSLFCAARSSQSLLLCPASVLHLAGNTRDRRRRRTSPAIMHLAHG